MHDQYTDYTIRALRAAFYLHTSHLAYHPSWAVKTLRNMIARPCNNSGPTKSVGSLVWQEFERLVKIAFAFSGTWCKMGLVSFASRCLAFYVVGCCAMLCYVCRVALYCVAFKRGVEMWPTLFLSFLSLWDWKDACTIGCLMWNSMYFLFQNPKS